MLLRQPGERGSSLRLSLRDLGAFGIWAFGKDLGGEPPLAAGREHVVVGLRRRQQRILDLIERDLAHSDPGLHAFYQGLSRRVGGIDMRWVEKIPRRLFGIFPRRRRRHERSLGERAKNWTAENWNDP